MGCGLARGQNGFANNRCLQTPLASSPAKPNSIIIKLKWRSKLNPIVEAKSFLECSSSFDQLKLQSLGSRHELY